MIISRQLSEFIGKGKHKVCPTPTAPPTKIVWLSTIRTQHAPRTYIISIGRSLEIVEANISYSISINADAGEWSHPKSICLMQQQPPILRLGKGMERAARGFDAVGGWLIGLGTYL